MESGLEHIPAALDATFRPKFKGTEDVERFNQLYSLWLDAFTVMKDRLLEDPTIREPTDKEVEYARAQAEVIKRIREAYPGIKPALGLRKKLPPEFRKMLLGAKRLRNLPNQTLVYPSGPGLVIRCLELYTKIQAQAEEIQGLALATSGNRDPPHMLAIFKAMATTAVDLKLV